MPTQIKLPITIQQLLRCPICKSKLELLDGQFRCTNAKCGTFFPIINGIPILLDESSSVFSIDDFVYQRDTFFNLSPENKSNKPLTRLIEFSSKNIKGKQNYDKFAKLLHGKSSNPRVLVIGGSILGQGMRSLLLYSSIDLIESDVSFGPRTMLICDAHDLPFENESFDGVIAQAVLEHVVDPYRCVEEIYRVLKKKGFVYAETPFIQQVHGGRYDFIRFTYLGHRYLFKKFEEVDSGAVCGPGMALTWSYQYFLLSFTDSPFIRKFLHVFAFLTSFYLKYFDYYLIKNVGTLDAASGCYFLGQKSDQILSHRELIKLYKGAF